MIRVAIVGAGGIGKKHAACYEENPHTEVVAFCDLVKELAEKAAGPYGCPTFTSVADMLGSDVEIDAAGVIGPKFPPPVSAPGNSAGPADGRQYYPTWGHLVRVADSRGTGHSAAGHRGSIPQRRGADDRPACRDRALREVRQPSRRRPGYSCFRSEGEADLQMVATVGRNRGL